MKVLEQTEDWSCGIYSIYHCLTYLGLEFDPVKETKRFNKFIRNKTGLSPNDLLKIVEKEGVGYEEIICSSAESSKIWIAQLKKKLNKGYPVMVLVRNWGHWISIIQFKKNRYVVANSESTSGKTGSWSEATLLRQASNPGDDTIAGALLPKIYGIDNLYGISIEL